jgi:microcystin-dependent protein
MQLGNVLAAQQQISLEARKSFALPFYFKVRGNHPTARPVDLEDCTITFTVGQESYRGGNILINKQLEVLDEAEGQAQLNLQAAELDLPEGDYPYMVSLVTADGYSAAVLKGYVHVLENVSPFKSNVFNTAVSQSITLTMQQNNRVTVEISALDAGELTIGDVTTVASTEDASATITGVWPRQKLNLWIPRGEGADDLGIEVAARIAADGVLQNQIDSITGSYATNVALAAEAVLARNASNLTSGTVPDGRISAAIARVSAMNAGDSAVQGAIDAHIADATAAHAASAVSFASTPAVPETTVQGAIEFLSTAAFPAGVILPYGGSSAPAGFLMADGSAVSRTTYADLFAVYGTQYGIGDGFTTFNLPNLKGRVPVGRDGAQTEFDTLGEAGGAKTHTLVEGELPSHTHTINHTHTGVVTDTEPAHNHDFTTYKAEANDHDHNNSGSPSWAAATTDGSAVINTDSDGAHAHNVTVPAYSGSSGAKGSGQAHNNLQPYLTLNYIIKV